MFINADVKSLELVCAAFLSQDPVLMNEIITGKDLHEDNRVYLKLPTRLSSKVFVFRLTAELKLREFGEHREPTTPSQGRARMKNCINCGISFVPTGKNHKRCVGCAKMANKKAIADWQSKYRTKYPGTGKGGTPHFEEKNPMFSHGRCVFRRWARERLIQLDYCCERCGVKIDPIQRGTWAGHHKDHNSANNIRENLEILCRKCHAIEHECWLAFQGVTTIPKGSTLETAEARNPEKSGDDIVCST